jgi:hypothetical protein
MDVVDSALHVARDDGAIEALEFFAVVVERGKVIEINWLGDEDSNLD